MDKNDLRFDIVLDASDPEFHKKLIEALGVSPGEKLEILTPQFERNDGVVVRYCPHTLEEYAALPTYSESTLKKMGCRIWDKKGNTVLWLFPKEWYDYIPDGLEITTISNKRKQFVKGKTSDDIRFGLLAYGFEAAPENEP